MIQETHFQIQGMSQDLAYQLFNPKHAFECRNIRINTTDENSLLSLTNEQGNKLTNEITIEGEENRNIQILGVGQFSEYCVFFCKDKNLGKYKVDGVDTEYTTGNDFIFLFNNQEEVIKIYQGDLNFGLDNTIRTVCVYENEDVQKVYWIDGKNPPRVLNIAGNVSNSNRVKKVQAQKIDFLPKLKFNEIVQISKTSGGQFPAGVIQYAFTYSDKNLQESNLWYISPLYYITHTVKGAEAGATCNTAFKIDFRGLDTTFDYVQIYVIIRTSLNATPACYRIANIPTTTTSFTDNGSLWEASSIEQILGKQLGTFIPKTIASKDSTLFLGNYTINSPYVDSKSGEINQYLEKLKGLISIETESDLIGEEKKDKRTFRSGEYYRIGLQFQDEYGTPSNVIFLKDIQAPITTLDTMLISNKVVQLPLGRVTPTESTTDGEETPTSENEPTEELENLTPDILIPEELKQKYKRVRLLMVDRTTLPHRTICQGVLCPTVYRVFDRVTNSPFAMSSWSMRTALFTNNTPLDKNTSAHGEIINQLEYHPIKTDINNNIIEPYSECTIHLGAAQDSYPLYFYLQVWVIRRLEYQVSKSIFLKWNLGVTNYKLAYDVSPSDYYWGNSSWAIDKDKIWYSTISDGDYAVYNISPMEYDSADDPHQTNAQLKEYILERLQDTIIAGNTIKLSSMSLPKTDPEYHVYAKIHNASNIINNLISQWKDNKDVVSMALSNPSEAAYGGGFSLVGRDNIEIEKTTRRKFSAGTTFDYTSESLSESEAEELAKSIGQPFFCDHNILTFHSPDVEKYQAIIDSNSNIKYRVIGYTNMEKSTFGSYIKASSPKSRDPKQGLQVVPKHSIEGIYNAPLWQDTQLFQTYIWHRSMTLGGQQVAENDGVWYGQYTRKIMSNVHQCGNSYRFQNYPDGVLPIRDLQDATSLVEDNPIFFPEMGTPRVFNADEITALRLEVPVGVPARVSPLIYYGNVDILHQFAAYKIPINIGGEIKEDDSNGSTDPCLIRYKSAPHVVMPMSFFTNEQEGSTKIMAPALPVVGTSPVYANDDKLNAYLWSSVTHGFFGSSIDTSDDANISDEGNILYIAELYQDIEAHDIYGDENEESLSKVSWIPISTWEKLEEGAKLTGYGDCFIGRWECLKTYAYSEDDIQSYIDITSLVIESDTNLDERYDNYKGITDATIIKYSNFNLFNPVYNQNDNLFTYRTLSSMESINNFQNQICWSEVKTLGEELDQWCQINVGNNTDLQGEYGELKALKTYNNSLFCLQDDAIYKLNYNTRVTISPSDGVPIQITNNYRVEPPLLLKSNCGIVSPDHVVVSSNNMYFFDGTRKKIFLLDAGDTITDLSGNKGINSTVTSSGLLKNSFFDYTINDVYFNFGKEKGALGFNEDLAEFTSWYDYGYTEFMFSINDNTYVTFNNKIFKQREGKYNNFFGEYKPYYVEVLANNDPLKSKTFTNVEFTMASDSHEVAFDEIQVSTSYQYGEEKLHFNKFIPSNLKRKFRLWRANIPRNKDSMDRMRDTWCKIKLIKNPIEDNVEENNKNDVKTRVNNINITYLAD